jgi:hypothetical protein
MHGCLEIPDLFLVLNMMSHSFAALTREILCSTLEINLVFPRTHACIILYIYYRFSDACNRKFHSINFTIFFQCILVLHVTMEPSPPIRLCFIYRNGIQYRGLSLYTNHF